MSSQTGRLVTLPHHVKAVLLERSAEYGGVGLHVLQGRIFRRLHLHGGGHLHGLGDPLEQTQLDHADVLQLPEDPHTPGEQDVEEFIFDINKILFIIKIVE